MFMSNKGTNIPYKICQSPFGQSQSEYNVYCEVCANAMWKPKRKERQSETTVTTFNMEANEWTKNHQNKRCKQDISTNYRIWSVNKMKRERKCLVGKTHGKVKLKYNCANAMSWSHRSSNNNKYTPRTHTQCIHLLCFHWRKSTHSTNHEDKWKLVQKTTIRNKSGLLSSLLITY